MTYVPKTWENEVPATTPLKYRIDDDTLGTLATSATIAQVTALTTPGTAVDATNLNHIEQGIADVEVLANAAQAAADAAAIRIAGAVYKNAMQSINDSAFTTMTWDVMDFDSGGIWGAGSPTRLVVPATGIYLVGISIFWAVSNVGNRIADIYKGGTLKARNVCPNNTGINATNTITNIISATAGDYFEAKVWQNSGGALNVDHYGGFSRFWMTKV